jgi:hypothetical protein
MTDLKSKKLIVIKGLLFIFIVVVSEKHLYSFIFCDSLKSESDRDKLNACISAKESRELTPQSCCWAAIAAIATFVGAIVTIWTSLHTILFRYFN